MNFDIQQYLNNKNFRVFESQTLFPLDFNTLRSSVLQHRCPFCGNKLKLPFLKRKNYICSNSKKHPKPFILGEESYQKLSKMK